MIQAIRKLFFLAVLLLVGCQPRTKPPLYIDLSTHHGKAPLEVVGYVFFYEDYDCAEVVWAYWYSGFSMDKNEASEKVCGKKVVTHEFMFTVPGWVKVQILVKYKGKKIQRLFSVSVEE